MENEATLNGVALYRDAPNEIDGGNYIDGTDIPDNFGRRAARYF
ncbi:MAG: hypothetical protein R2784_18450 [Saprospiraceae bacterium]